MLQRPRENRVSSWLYLKQNTDRPKRNKPTLLQAPTKKKRLKKASTTNQEPALTAGTRAGTDQRRRWSLNNSAGKAIRPAGGCSAGHVVFRSVPRCSHIASAAPFG